MRKSNMEKGITLVALIITIIVLLILAVVAIRGVTGDGILQYAQNSADKHQAGVDKENTVLDSYLAELEEHNTVSSESDEETDLAPGLYNANDELLASWSTLVKDYSLDITTNYDTSGYTSSTHIAYILNNYDELSSGVKLVIGDDVTTIGKQTFRESKLTNIIIPDSVTTIETYAFECTTYLTSITIPNSVTNIVDGMFALCSSLKNITIPDSVTSIGEDAFHSCTSIESITIPNGVTSISDYAFLGCSSLASITIADSVTNIGNSVFENCNSLTTIHGVTGSYAEEYANDNGYTFVAI